MSPRSKSVPADVIGNETEAVTKPVKDIKEIKEQSKIMEQSIIDEYEDDEEEVSFARGYIAYKLRYGLF